jgi:methylated-DNA-protein-cysteine methyltransferase-like protein
MTDIFTARAREIISQIPSGMVATYGLIARYAGNCSGARQVARILYSSSDKYDLPWHRVVNRNGQVSPRSSMGHIWQRQLLEEEGVVFSENGRIDLAVYLWQPERFG